MIKVQELTKIYKSKNRTNCVALDHVSFTLPDNGMVFVLGKSGSGKSTLLNLLGGLDEFEEGEIFFEDEQLSGFTQQDFYDYRCRHIGFVFQDFHLLEELTVEENIKLVFDLESADYGDRILYSLEKVGMLQYASRYPRELSGGQKQRVAMARAIAKNPEVILCDEPTGNLDADNSKQILNLLKEFSKTKLVIIVSHNIPDAEAYADRILELRDGKIMRDVERREGYANAFGVDEEGTLTLPYNKTLSGEEIDHLVDGIRSGDVKKVVQNDDGFHPVKDIAFRGRPYSRRNAGMSLKNSLRLTRTMMRNQYLRFLITALTATLIVSCFSVFQSFLHYDVNITLSNAMIRNGFPAMVYQKAEVTGSEKSLSANNLIHINEGDLAAFRNTKYGNQMYVLYAHSLPILANSGDTIGQKSARDPRTNVDTFFVYETYGVLACNKDYLTRVFGKNGELEVIAGDISQPNKGIIITDYVADGIMMGNPEQYPDYESIIGVFYNSKDIAYGKIDAIIETHYEEEYGDLKNRMDQMRKNGDKDGLKALKDSDEFLRFAEKVHILLGVTYTFSKDYVADTKTSNEFGIVSYTGKMSYIINGIENTASNSPQIVDESHFEKKDKDNKAPETINPGEVVLGDKLYNTIMSSLGLDAAKGNFEPFDITMVFRSRNGEELGTRTYRVTGVTSRATNGFYLDTQDFLDIREFTVTPYALYFEDAHSANVLNAVAAEHSFVVSNAENDTATRLNRLIVTFSDLFRMFEAFLLAICVAYLAAFGANVIQRNKYQIGIIKSLGGKTNQLARIFLAQLLVVGAMIFALSGVGIFAATRAANSILMNSMKTHMNIEIFHFEIIDFFPKLAAIDLVLVVLLTVVSSLVPLIAVHKIKPINIIKAKE